MRCLSTILLVFIAVVIGTLLGIWVGKNTVDTYAFYLFVELMKALGV